MNEKISNYLKAYVLYVSDLLALEEIPKIEIDENIDSTCALDNYTIKINLKKIPKDDEMFLFMALAHELRHAYQIECLSRNYEQDFFTQEQLKLIQSELDNYHPHGQDYKKQFIELDAFGFAEFIMNATFNVRCLYNNTFSQDEIKKIYDKAGEFRQVYYPSEIIDSMIYAEFEPINKKDFS